ncbi:MAG: hypothetical protein FWD18_08175 [Micrococcales bacterium]|nr:hypothetical protein [Micrococcales bacterium]
MCKGPEWSAWWWLRSPGNAPANVANVNTDGNLNDNGNNNSVGVAAVGGVRPDSPRCQKR